MPQVLTHKGFKKYEGLLISENKLDKLELLFSNNKTIKCTPDHKFMLCDGSFIEAKNLEYHHILHNNIKITKKNNIYS